MHTHRTKKASPELYALILSGHCLYWYVGLKSIVPVVPTNRPPSSSSIAAFNTFLTCSKMVKKRGLGGLSLSTLYLDI